MAELLSDCNTAHIRPLEEPLGPCQDELPPAEEEPEEERSEPALREVIGTNDLLNLLPPPPNQDEASRRRFYRRSPPPVIGVYHPPVTASTSTAVNANVTARPDPAAPTPPPDYDRELCTSGGRYGTARGRLRRGHFDTIDFRYESFHYEESSCALKKSHDQKVQKNAGWWEQLSPTLTDFVCYSTVGILTGLTAFIIDTAIHFAASYKYRLFGYFFDQIQESGWQLLSALAVVLAINGGLVLLAGIGGVLVPVSTGSGIPHIKCYLNGVKIPELMRIKTYFAKVAGVIFSVVGGMPVGKEGPMIHSGAIIAAGISQGMSVTFRLYTSLCLHNRNDAAKRDFVAGGSAAGVAAAFGAPLGGVLFAIEEGASFIDPVMIVQVLLCSLTSFFTLNLLKSLLQGTFGDLSNGGLINFGTFDDAEYNLYVFFVFFVIAILGGVSGAFFNALNTRLTQWRMRFITTKPLKVAEAVVWGMIVACSAFLVMMEIGDCKHVGPGYDDHRVKLYCGQLEYHAGAALWFETPEACVKELFHTDLYHFNFLSLSIFVAIYFVLAVYTYGLTISSGLFIPTLLIGAAWGRLVGMLLHTFVPSVDWGDVGKYSLMGATAQLSGTVRMTFSICAIITEATGNLTYSFPILVVAGLAKVVGDLFNEGLYDIHINLTGVPLLHWYPPKQASCVTVKDIMSTPVHCLTVRSRVKDVMDLLHGTYHDAYPVVDLVQDDDKDASSRRRVANSTRSFGRLRGIVLRRDIVTMLHNMLYDDNVATNESWGTYMERYPAFFQIHVLNVSPFVQRTAYLDFRNVLNPAVTTVQTTLTFENCYHQFRRVGLHHIVVVNDAREVVGMITRKDLALPMAHSSHGQLLMKTPKITRPDPLAYYNFHRQLINKYARV